MAAKAKTLDLINSNNVYVFSKSYCPYCKTAKKLLKDSNIQFEAIELDAVDDGDDIQAALKDLSGQRTVPNIYFGFGAEHIGGCSELTAKFEDAGDKEILIKLSQQTKPPSS